MASRSMKPKHLTEQQEDSVNAENDTALTEVSDDNELEEVSSGSRQIAPDSQKALVRSSFIDYIPAWTPRYFRESIIELSKVTWPTRKEAFNLSGIVLILAVITAIVFGLLDIGVYSVLQFITNHIQ